MKRSHEYDSPVLSRIVSVITVLAICICSVCTCLTTYKMTQLTAAGGTSNTETTTSSSTGNGSNQGGSTTPSAETTTAAGGSTNTGTANTDGGNAGSGDASDPAAVLAKYTEVMNNSKKAVKTFNKKEWQELPSVDLGNSMVTSIAQPIIDKYMTPEADAEEQSHDKPDQFPVIHATAGCLLTDASAIKSASMKDNGDGTGTITLVLNDEEGPEPCAEGATSAPSNTGAVFSPISKKSINDELAKISAIKVNSFDLNYHDCTSTITYNTSTNQVTDVNQVMNISIKANVKVTIATVDASGELIDTVHIYNITY